MASLKLACIKFACTGLKHLEWKPSLCGRDRLFTVHLSLKFVIDSQAEDDETAKNRIKKVQQALKNIFPWLSNGRICSINDNMIP